MDYILLLSTSLFELRDRIRTPEDENLIGDCCENFIAIYYNQNNKK